MKQYCSWGADWPRKKKNHQAENSQNSKKKKNAIVGNVQSKGLLY